MNRARRKNDLAAAQLAPAVAPLQTQSDRARAREQHAVDLCVPEDGQVVAPACCFEIGIVCADPDAVAIVDRIRRDAERMRRIVVGRPRIAEIERCFAAGLVDRAPLRNRRSIDRDGAVVAMPRRVTETQIGLAAIEVRQHVLVGPAFATFRRPFVKILDGAADGDLSVYRRTSRRRRARANSGAASARTCGAPSDRRSGDAAYSGQ